MELEDKICGYFKVPLSCLRSKSKKHEHALARSYTLYFLHIRYGKSNRWLAKEYDYNARSVIRIISSLKYLINIDKEYKKIYNELFTVLQFS
jgi:chromosomal replication initiation ATPase DnaA